MYNSSLLNLNYVYITVFQYRSKYLTLQITDCKPRNNHSYHVMKKSNIKNKKEDDCIKILQKLIHKII